jgi:hypothetical protein
MSEAYLQRLIDRAASSRPPMPLAEPSGVSFSPVAVADQRLNNPRLAEDFSFHSSGFADADHDDDATAGSMQPILPSRKDASFGSAKVASPMTRQPEARPHSPPVRSNSAPAIDARQPAPVPVTGRVSDRTDCSAGRFVRAAGEKCAKRSHARAAPAAGSRNRAPASTGKRRTCEP